jgi:hypothetical protein
MDGADHPLLPAAVADRAAGGLHPAGQRRGGHEPAAPDLVQQLGLGDDTVAVAHEVGQHLEHLRLQMPGLAVPAQLIAQVVELAVATAAHAPLLPTVLAGMASGTVILALHVAYQVRRFANMRASVEAVFPSSRARPTLVP